MKSPFAVAKKNALVPTLYVGNLNYKLNEEGLQKFLSTYGKVTYLFMPTDKRTKRRKGIAFAQFSKKDEFERALSGLNGRPYMGRKLKVSKAVENESMPFSTQEARKEVKAMPTTKKKKMKKGLDLLLEVKKS
ncbi:MAG: RNA-binding protein [Bdellovibrionota bacterium]|jgi:RNA recognition motif-containing protein|nr:RNA-binding protein [Bdellovibrionota bacterium]